VKGWLLLLAVVLLALVGCGDRARPEGLVERWLLSLNQGAAGRPERYADAGTSRRVLPGFERRSPGDLDVIEVGAARRNKCSFDVPFRVVTVDGGEVTGFAVIPICPTAPILPIGSLELRQLPAGVFPSGGGSAFGTDRAAAWAVAAAVAVAITVISIGLMELVRRTAVR
jgi:hypothetical protein